MALSVFNALPVGSRLNVLADGMWMPGVEDLAMLGPLWGLVATLIVILIGALVLVSEAVCRIGYFVWNVLD